MKIFITGASGFVGGAAGQSLAKQNMVLAMARSEATAKKVESLGAKAVRCDLLNVSAENLSGCDVVVHCAAFAEEWGQERDFHVNNVLATQRLLDVAREAGVSRFIFIGTEAALFRGQDLVNIDESYPYATDSPYPYSRSKGEAERLVLAANGPGFLTLSLRPRMVWGPEDRSILSTLLEMIESGRFAWIGRGDFQTSTTHIFNLVYAIELALTRGVGGNAYFIANDEVVQMRSFLSRYIETQGVTPPKKSVPKGVARTLARAFEAVWWVFGIRSKPPLVRFSIDIMSANCTLNIAKAKRDLGYQPVITTVDGLLSMPRLS